MSEIIKAAADSYITKGIRMEIRDVAQQASLGYGTVYHYYPHKFELLEDACRQGFTDAQEMITPILTATTENSYDKLKLYCTGLFQAWPEHSVMFLSFKCACEGFHELPSNASSRLNDEFSNQIIQPLVQVIGLLTEADLAEQVARLLIGALVGCYTVTQCTKNKDQRVISQQSEQAIVDILLAQFKPKEERS
nr:TetR/AcrR family transcriptional regulator [Paenibacillus shirakamiensis]